MAGKMYRNELISRIEQAMTEFKKAGSLQHKGLRGRVREIAFQHLLQPLLPPVLEIGTGTIIDARDRQSGQTDVVVHSKMLLPPISHDDSVRTFMADGCLATVAVKSVLNATELRETLTSARKMAALGYTSGVRDEQTGQEKVPVVTRTLFAFDSDLRKQTEKERYEKYDSESATCPLIKMFCVVGKGTWFFSTPQNPSEQGRWGYQRATNDYDEVMFFLLSIVEIVKKVFDNRGRPQLSNYIWGSSGGQVLQ